MIKALQALRDCGYDGFVVLEVRADMLELFVNLIKTSDREIAVAYFFAKPLDFFDEICYNISANLNKLIKSGGGTGPVKPGNL